MNHWSISTWVIALIVGAVALYGLHRLALRLEAAGHLYYLHKRPKGGGSSPFVVLQQFIEPKAQQILKAHDIGARVGQDRERGRGSAPGENPTSAEGGDS
jgi:hypothetical protein